MTQEKPAEHLADQISSLLENPEVIKKAADAAAESVASYIKKHPYQSIAISVGVGFALGMFLTKKTKS